MTFVWTGWTGAPGYTNLYFAGTGDIGDQATALDTFWNAIKALVPSSVTISLNEAAEIEDSTGELLGAISLSGVGTYVGTGAGVIAAPAGLCITWRTAAIVGGRRLRGRTFIVPLASSNYQADGTLYNPALATAPAQDLIDDSGGTLVVWHRPVAGAGGSSAPATDAYVRDRVSVLRSRAK